MTEPLLFPELDLFLINKIEELNLPITFKLIVQNVTSAYLFTLRTITKEALKLKKKNKLRQK